MKTPKLIIILFSILLFCGCVNDSESDLIDNTTSIQPITYNGTVRNIINNNCVRCHSNPPVNGAPMPLTTYENVKNAVLNRGLLDRISRPQGSPGMMPNGGIRLPQSTIDQIVKWKNDGLLQ